jgi:type I restriction enzyme S subunit
MKDHVIDYGEARRISAETFDLWTKRLRPRFGDLLLAREAPVGPVVLIPESEDVAPGQRTVLLRPDAAQIDSRFLYYQLRNPIVQQRLSERAAGSTVAHLNVADVRDFDVEVPELANQRAIAEVLGALDDKIAANAKLVRLIRDRFQAVYSEAIGASACSVSLESVVTFHNRRRMPLSAREREARVGTVPYYGATGQFGFVDEAIFDEPLVLVGEDGSVVAEDGRPVVQYIWGKSWVNNHAHVLTGNGLSTELLWYALQRADVRPLVTGAVLPKLSMGNLKTLELDVPSGSVLSNLDVLCRGETRLVRSLTEESRMLEVLRDTLLPQLMSGKLRVRDAEKQVEELV